MTEWFHSKEALASALEGVGAIREGELIIRDANAFRTTLVDRLVATAVFSEDDSLKKLSRWIIWEASQHLGCPSSSIQDLYEARARDTYTGLTVPAINIRTLTYEFAQTIFKVLKKMDAGACLFEIAKSEIDYTLQRPAEFSTCILGAALRENYEGPVFIQGDHVQANAKKYAVDPAKELASLKALIKEQLDAGFYNIDIDTSTLVDLSQKTTLEEQRANFENCAILTQFIRENEPKGITVSVGGEIGEVGGKNSTLEELEAFMSGYRAKLPAGLKGISKMSIQTGTSHGGVPLPDGSVAKVKLDFACLQSLSKAAREKYALAGAVQHGASTLPDDAFNRFPETETIEVHLATGFQNIIYDHPSFPAALLSEIHSYLEKNMAGERKEGETDAQFLYKTRKKGFGPFKRAIWDLNGESKSAIFGSLSLTFEKIFKKLNIEGTRGLVSELVTPIFVHRSLETGLL